MGTVQWAGSPLNPGKESSAAPLIALAENLISQRISTLTVNKRAQLTWPVNLPILKLLRKKIFKPLCTDFLVSGECTAEGICMLLYFGLGEGWVKICLQEIKKRNLQLLYDISFNTTPEICLFEVF